MFCFFHSTKNKVPSACHLPQEPGSIAIPRSAVRWREPFAGGDLWLCIMGTETPVPWTYLCSSEEGKGREERNMSTSHESSRTQCYLFLLKLEDSNACYLPRPVFPVLSLPTVPRHTGLLWTTQKEGAIWNSITQTTQIPAPGNTQSWVNSSRGCGLVWEPHPCPGWPWGGHLHPTLLVYLG